MTHKLNTWAMNVFLISISNFFLFNEQLNREQIWMFTFTFYRFTHIEMHI